MNSKEECLRTACDIVNGARQECYGDAEDNFQTIATLWETYLKATGCDVVINSNRRTTWKRQTERWEN